MKYIKRILAVLMAIACVIALIPATGAKAADNKGVPKKIRSYPGSSEYTNFQIDGKKTIKSVSTSSKNIIAKITGHSESKDNGEMTDNSYTLCTLADKEGKYTVTLKFSDKSKSEITVYDYPGPEVTVKINGKANGYLNRTSDKEAKVEVSIQKDYEIKKIEYSTAKTEKTESGSETKEVYKTFKSGDKIPINKKPWAYSYSYKSSYDGYSYESSNWNEELFAYTYVRITYKDKYTKENDYYYSTIASVLVP